MIAPVAVKVPMVRLVAADAVIAPADVKTLMVEDAAVLFTVMPHALVVHLTVPVMVMGPAETSAVMSPVAVKELMERPVSADKSIVPP